MAVKKDAVVASKPSTPAKPEPVKQEPKAEYDKDGLPIIDKVDPDNMEAGKAYRLREGKRVKLSANGNIMRY